MLYLPSSRQKSLARIPLSLTENQRRLREIPIRFPASGAAIRSLLPLRKNRIQLQSRLPRLLKLRPLRPPRNHPSPQRHQYRRKRQPHRQLRSSQSHRRLLPPRSRSGHRSRPRFLYQYQRLPHLPFRTKTFLPSRTDWASPRIRQ